MRRRLLGGLALAFAAAFLLFVIGLAGYFIANGLVSIFPTWPVFTIHLGSMIVIGAAIAFVWGLTIPG